MTSMSGDVPNEQWESDLEADQLDDLAAREAHEDADAPPDALDTDAIGAPLDARIPNERWENDLEASALDTEAEEEGAEERGDIPM